MTNVWRDRASGQYVIGKPELLDYFSGKRFELIGKVPESNLCSSGVYLHGVSHVSKNTLRKISENGKRLKKVRSDIELNL